MAELEGRWLSVNEIDKNLGFSNYSGYKWIDKHSIPAHRMGLLWQFKKDQFGTWVGAGDVAEQLKMTSKTTATAKKSFNRRIYEVPNA